MPGRSSVKTSAVVDVVVRHRICHVVVAVVVVVVAESARTW